MINRRFMLPARPIATATANVSNDAQITIVFQTIPTK